VSRTTAIRIAAAVLAAIIVAFTVFTYLSYTAAFTPTDTVTVTSPRAGLVMDKDAKVKYRGIQIGKVEDIATPAIRRKLTLAINATRCATSRPTRRCASPAPPVFGAKSVEFIAPKAAVAGTPLRPGAPSRSRRAAGSQHAVPVADRRAAQDRPGRPERHPEALAEGLRGHGDDFGARAGGPEYPYPHNSIRRCRRFSRTSAGPRASPTSTAMPPRLGHRGRQHCRPSTDTSSISRPTSTRRCWRRSAWPTTLTTRWRRPRQT
jgi:hypothetical protein